MAIQFSDYDLFCVRRALDENIATCKPHLVPDYQRISSLITDELSDKAIIEFAHSTRVA